MVRRGIVWGEVAWRRRRASRRGLWGGGEVGGWVSLRARGGVVCAR